MYRRVVRLLSVAFLLPLIYVLALWLLSPDVSVLAHETPVRTSYMRLRAAEKRLPEDAYSVGVTPIDRVSLLLVCAVIKAEDRSFFRHRGVDMPAFQDAALAWLKGDARRGGSTLTQQLARNLYLSPERTVHRKLRELMVARELEDTLGKRRILELYLNTVEWGEGVWGVANASRFYFGRAPDDLDAFEASFLASLLAAPRRPLVGGNAVRARAVQRRVLRQLKNAGLLSTEELQRDLLRMSELHVALEKGETLGPQLLTLHAPAGDAPRSPSSGTFQRDDCIGMAWKRAR
ncbi:biosynthetic peptidoglycan transglycosylase [Myxococcus hansupus]|uniref:biosynthetic peptidoglycan transglycosylase n=1 Tax=Pseudomyxococcus hansupus TaxID=1297742 RepID=UPI000272D6C2|nr:biosynthetic peptidoglycan transglycosylase [Myxococcus hansupus]